jgi:hypothetical protein
MILEGGRAQEASGIGPRRKRTLRRGGVRSSAFLLFQPRDLDSLGVPGSSRVVGDDAAVPGLDSDRHFCWRLLARPGSMKSRWISLHFI